MNTRTPFHRALREERQASGQTLMQLSDKLGISHVFLHKLERDEKAASPALLDRIWAELPQLEKVACRHVRQRVGRKLAGGCGSLAEDIVALALCNAGLDVRRSSTAGSGDLIVNLAGGRKAIVNVNVKCA